MAQQPKKEPFALIIEDDRKLVHIFAKALEEANFAVEIVQDGATAQQRLAETVPAMVVLDLHLPHVSGEEILHQIRTDSRLAKTRVIVVTADYHLAERVREQVDLLLDKPISFRQLRDLAFRLRPHQTLSAD